VYLHVNIIQFLRSSTSDNHLNNNTPFHISSIVYRHSFYRDNIKVTVSSFSSFVALAHFVPKQDSSNHRIYSSFHHHSNHYLNIYTINSKDVQHLHDYMLVPNKYFSELFSYIFLIHTFPSYNII